MGEAVKERGALGEARNGSGMRRKRGLRGALSRRVRGLACL